MIGGFWKFRSINPSHDCRDIELRRYEKMSSKPVAATGISPLAGKPASKELLVDLAQLEKLYYENGLDLGSPAQMVIFGTNGHRGSPFHRSFTEAHILAITQAICDYRRKEGTDGPLYM